MSEDTLLLEVMRKEFQQVTGVVLIKVVDMGEEVVQPLVVKTEQTVTAKTAMLLQC